VNLEFDKKYFSQLAEHSTDFISYGDVLIFVSAANLWAFVLHGTITREIMDDLASRGYQVLWAREAMADLQTCTVNQYYIGQRSLDFGYYALL
jgi:hypothetical protein